ncbi:MAG TPA: hypothetical protein VGU45_05430 [Microvirga sp.]|nr:hypothetical protein [Microvirga sp.]
MSDEIRIIHFLNMWAVQYGDIILKRKSTASAAMSEAVALASKLASQSRPCRVVDETREGEQRIVWDSRRDSFSQG